mgnify:FL=1
MTLSLIATLMNALNTKATVDEIPGGGSCLAFDIPCRVVGRLDFEPEVPVLSKMKDLNDSVSSVVGAHGPKRVLVVDDDPLTRKLLKKILATFECVTEEASDGIECLEKILGDGHPYDMVLLDTMMPRMDGKTVLRRLKESNCKTTIVSVTANSTTNDVAELLELGAADVLGKPCRASDFRALWARHFPAA